MRTSHFGSEPRDSKAGSKSATASCGQTAAGSQGCGPVSTEPPWKTATDACFGQGGIGFSGFSGRSGWSGWSGAPGPSGYSSQSGYSGGSGTSGRSGWSGGSGYTGFSGGPGGSGYSGGSGWSGQSGLMGQSGYTGFSGSIGTSGYSGKDGSFSASGFSGGSGYSGQSGMVGTSGFTGYSGQSGMVGASGFTGYSGASGRSGWSGYSGVTGYSGYSSRSGYSGYSGKDGATSSGPATDRIEVCYNSNIDSPPTPTQVGTQNLLEFPPAVTSAVNFGWRVPFNCDVSQPATLRVYWAATTTDVASVVWQLNWLGIIIGQSVASTLTDNDVIVQNTSGIQDGLNYVDFPFAAAEDLIGYDEFSFRFLREGNLDAYGANVLVGPLTINYTALTGPQGLSGFSAASPGASGFSGAIGGSGYSGVSGATGTYVPPAHSQSAIFNNAVGNATLSYQMQGIGLSFTPLSTGVASAIATGNCSNPTIGAGTGVKLMYGTGTAPTLGQALTGTQVGGVVRAVNGNNVSTIFPFATQGIISSMSPGTPYWFDIALVNSNAAPSTSVVSEVSLSVMES